MAIFVSSRYSSTYPYPSSVHSFPRHFHRLHKAGMHDDIFASLTLSRVSGVGPVVHRGLVHHFGSAAAVLRASKRELCQVHGVSHKIADHILAPTARREAERIIEFAATHGIDVLCAGQPGYPANLHGFERAPPVLYHRGGTDLGRQRMLAVVGTRRISKEAGRQIERLLDPLREYDPIIVSGLAYGIDTAAHRRSLSLGLSTLAVMGSGLQYIYPYTNRRLAMDMCRQGGGLLTEYPHWVSPEREHFPARNRIVAMLAEMTLVVESDRSGGSIITANMAHELGRKVGACPGRGGDPATAGCNDLIRRGRAHLVDGAEDIVRLLGWEPDAPARPQLQLFVSLPAGQQRVVDALRKTADPLSVDQLLQQLGVPTAWLAGTLLELEMQGIISALPGQRYRLSACGTGAA